MRLGVVIFLAASFFVASAVAAGAASPSLLEAADAFYYNVSQDADGSNVYMRSFSASISPLERFDRMLKRQSRGFNFFPEFMGTTKPSQKASWSGGCFASTDAQVKVTGADSVEVVVTTSNKTHVVCDDIYLIANALGAYVHAFSFGKSHTLHISGVSSSEMESIAEDGLSVFLIKDHIFGSLADIWDTANLFFGPWSQQDSRQFVKDRLGIDYKPRTLGRIVPREEDVPSGTFVSTQRFEGSEVMIQYGTGSTVGHSTIAVRLNGSLHVCESTDKNGFPPYWPPPYGIQCHPWTEWLDLAEKAGYVVSLLPLSPERQKMFNETLAEAFVQSAVGLPYGYHNFLWGWYDTVNDNFPPPFSSEILVVGFSLFDHIKHNITKRMFLAGLNARLSVECDSFACIMAEAEKRNATLEEVLTWPEQDDWEYVDGKSMVCNVFVLETLKAAGVFGNLSIQATEMTPRDLYTLKIFDTKKLPGCADDGLEVCQIMGNWTMIYTDWNTIEPYDHMCEKCPTVWPTYDRPTGC